MSLKGTVWTPESMPAGLKRLRGGRTMTPERQEAYCLAHNERYRIVAKDPAKGPLIRQELEGRLLQRLSPKPRRIVGMLLAASPETRREVLGAFDSSGYVVYPWPVEP